jgi:osmotically-inducible protein OsmY
MADKNFNQGNQSNQDWERERNRSNQENDWSSQQHENTDYRQQQNRRMNQGQKDVGYSGDSARGMESYNQGSFGRVNYLPDNDDNRQYGNSGMDRNSGDYWSENKGSYGNAGHQQHNQDWNRQKGYGNSSYGNQQGNEGDWNRRQGQQGGSGGWSSDQGWQDRGRSNMNQGNDQRNYGNRNAGGHGNMGNDYNRGDRGNNENWWERTKDKVSDWFDNDDDDNRRNVNRNTNYGGGHRGKGPSDYRRSEDRIREDICDRLTDDDRVDASNIRVQIENDAVVLSGTVNSRDEKRRAEDLVESISGVRHVENRLRVGGGSSGQDRHLASHDYTGTTDRTGGIGTESGTTNEIIRNVQTDRKGGTDTGTTKNT